VALSRGVELEGQPISAMAEADSDWSGWRREITYDKYLDLARRGGRSRPTAAASGALRQGLRLSRLRP
jgi:hypothetical protein